MRLKDFLPPTFRELRRSHVAFIEPANLAVMWSNKAACTTIMKWVFLHNGLLPEALAYGRWIHRYRLRQYQKSSRYRSRLKTFARGRFITVKVVRNPFERAVSSFIHAYRTGYDDRAISEVLKRPLDRGHRFSFRDFVTFLERSDLYACNPHHRVQVSPVERRVLFRIRPRQIIKIENDLAKTLNELERSLGLPVSDMTNPLFASEHHTHRVIHQELAADLALLPRDGLPPASMFYDDDLRHRIARLYAEDFAYYGYSTAMILPEDSAAEHGIIPPGVPQPQEGASLSALTGA
jgi:hypothetical protein